MPRDIDIACFYADGSAPDRSHIPASALSQKWIDVCTNLLRSFGPVFEQSLGGNLSHIAIHMGGPIGRLLVDGHACLEFALLRGTRDEQDAATAAHFLDFLAKACAIVGSEVGPDAKSALDDCANRRTLLYFDYGASVDEQTRTAVAQLGIHLATAYADYA